MARGAKPPGGPGPGRAGRAGSLLLALVAAAGCRTTREREPANLHLARVTHTEAGRAWRLVEGGETVGWVVRYEDPARPSHPAAHYFSVRNPWHQELGTVDAHGRAWRFQPHEREARWVETGTLLAGARAVLGAGAGLELLEVPLSLLRESALDPVPRAAPGGVENL